MMESVLRSVIKAGEYHDSVSLMLAARELANHEGVQDAAVVMGTEANKAILSESGLINNVIMKSGPNDLVIVVKARNEILAEAALQEAEVLLNKKAPKDEPGIYTPKTLRGALSLHPDANVAVISVAGRYAAAEAWEALMNGLHVLLFSDNVSVDDEIALKIYARDHGLLLMGPGAGTAIINGVALGFANVLPPGPVGIISAAGTGLQEVSTLLARQGIGISQGIGTGGRDLNKDVAGIMMLEALKALQQESSTKVLVLISKPPDKDVKDKIINQVLAGDKPTVVCFLGAKDDLQYEKPNLIMARNLRDCAYLAASVVKKDVGDLQRFHEKENQGLALQAADLVKYLKPGQLHLRALFSGGTLCYEAQVVWEEMRIGPVYSNAPLQGASILPDPTKSQGHSAIDLGAEEFTVGRPHPMIDNDLRIRRLFQEARDESVAVILLDVVLGYGAHPDPASELAKAVKEAKEMARREDRELVVVASVTGTDADPQNFSRSVSLLQRSDVIVCDSNAAAAKLTGRIIGGCPGEPR